MAVMAQRKLKLNLISANDLKPLKGVKLLSGKDMEVYAVVSLSSDPAGTQQTTMADSTGGRNPIWNATIHFNVPASGAGWFLDVILFAPMHVVGERKVGEVHIALSELLSGASDDPVPAKVVKYQVLKNGQPQGVLNFSYKLGKVTQSADDYAPNSAAAYTPPTANNPPAGKPYAAPLQAGYYHHQQQAVRPQTINKVVTVLAVRIVGHLLDDVISGAAANFFGNGDGLDGNGDGLDGGFDGVLS